MFLLLKEPSFLIRSWRVREAQIDSGAATELANASKSVYLKFSNDPSMFEAIVVIVRGVSGQRYDPS